LNKNNLHIIIAVVGSVAILAIGALIFNQMHKNYQSNQLIIEKCFDKMDKEENLTVKKDGFWSPVACEKK